MHTLLVERVRVQPGTFRDFWKVMGEKSTETMSKSLATKNVAAVLVAVSMIFGFAFAFATPAKADVISDLQTQIQALLAQIAALQGPSSSSMSSAACHTFTQNLKQGSSGGEVMWVQQFLNSMSDTMVASSGAGSAGNETSSFGAKTKAAVVSRVARVLSTMLTTSLVSTTRKLVRTRKM